MRKLNLCPCRRCRPDGMTLRQAMRLCNDAAIIRRHGVDGLVRHKREQAARLAALRRRH